MEVIQMWKNKAR